MTEELIVAASPDLSRHLCVGSPEDLVNKTLLRADNPDTWATWFEQLGLARSIPLKKMPTGLAFTDDVSLVEAAVEGLGIALLRSRLIERELLTKRLVPLLPHRLKTTYAYYIVTPINIKPSEQVLCLIDWLRSEAMK